MKMRLLLGSAALIAISSARAAGPPPSAPMAAGPAQPGAPPRPAAVLKDAAARQLDPLRALCLSGAGPMPADKQLAEHFIRIYSFAQTRGVVLTSPSFGDATGSDDAPAWRVCTAVASLPAAPLKDLERFEIVQIAATPGWTAQCVGVQDKVQDCLDELLRRIDAAGQVPTGSPRVTFAAPQSAQAETSTAIGVPTRAKPLAPRLDASPPSPRVNDRPGDANPPAGARK